MAKIQADNERKSFVKQKIEKKPFTRKIRQTRLRPTLDEHLDHYNRVLNYINGEIEKKERREERGIKKLKTMRNMILDLRAEVSRIKRYEKTVETSGGLKKKFSISSELASFLQIDPATRLSRQEVTCAICVYINYKENESRPEMTRWSYLNPEGARNLQNQFDKKKVIPDKKLSKLLHYKEYQRSIARGEITKRVYDKETKTYNKIRVEQDTLYYQTIQHLINRHFIKE